MGTKLKIGKEEIEMPRGVIIPREGDVIFATLKGQTKEKVYTVDQVEITYNFNMALPIGNTIITLKEPKEK